MQSIGLSDGRRAVPDVSFNADPSTGVSVYDSVAYDGESGWFDVGGTSAAAPAWAGLVAITDQGLATVGQGTISTTALLTELYSLPSSDFNDVTTGSNGYSATAGYDLATGLGTPRANLLVSGLVADAGSSTSSTTSSSSSSSGVTVVSTTSSAPSPTSPTSTRSKHKHTIQKKTTRTKVTRAKVKHTEAKKKRVVKLKPSKIAVRTRDLVSVAPADAASDAVDLTAGPARGVDSSSGVDRRMTGAPDRRQALAFVGGLQPRSQESSWTPPGEREGTRSPRSESAGTAPDRVGSPRVSPHGLVGSARGPCCL